ncbi:MAG: methyltransferase domain-containing protein [Candidatus Marinimicrobia bacterium]|nr:methyltransferase domain-containing protein [Candidatus Neomarinimicrobiota bacterium]
MYTDTHDDYSATSAWYDRLLNPVLNHIRRALAEWITEHQPTRVLDVGCGTGKQLSLLPDDVDAVGIDISEGMLERAKTQAGGRCQWGDATSIPFEDGEFDLVISQFALHEKDITTINAELEEVRRVLKPTGVFSVTDFDIPKKLTIFSKILGWGIRQVEKHAGGEHYENYKVWMERGGLGKILTDAGWGLIEDKPFYKGNIRLMFWRKCDGSPLYRREKTNITAFSF